MKPIKLSNYRLGDGIGFFLTLLVGVLLLFSKFRLGETLVRSSYDWSFDLASLSPKDIRDSEVVLVYLDEDSHKSLDQPFNRPWDRALHAQLLDRLKAQGARAVVFDIIFSDPGPSEPADAALEEAIRKNGRVILAADYSYFGSANGQLSTPRRSITLPYERFRTNAAAVGLAMLQLEQDQDFTPRRHLTWIADRQLPSLSWAAAGFLKMDFTKDPNQRQAERWIKYYGGPEETLPHASYVEALNGETAPNFFRDKIVFIGARPMTGSFIERRDELRSPFSSWGRVFKFMPAVEVHATETLNLVREDWLTRLPPVAELGILTAAAALFGFGLFRFRPLAATGMAVLGAACLTVFALLLFSHANIVFPWMIIVAAQIPVALLWCIVFKSVDWYLHRQRLEQERRVADHRIREQAALLNKAQDAIIVHDLNWQASFWNKSAERIYGWTSEEVIGKGLAELILNGDQQKLENARQDVLARGEWVGELKQKNRAGSHIIVQSRWSLVRDSDGNADSILVINTDMTEQKKLEAQFLRAQRMESIGTLAGGIAHDLNNVLAPIVMGVDLLKRTVNDERSLKFLTNMAASAKRGGDMVKQVLTFTRGQGGDRGPLQLSHLIREMQKIAQETFPKSIEVQTQMGKDLSPVLGDATQWHQVLLNLCVNARDAMPEGGKITISAENVQLTEAQAKLLLGAIPGRHLLLKVSDTGTGIPPGIIDKIFEPFFTTKEIGKGTGLGLSTVASILKSHGAVLDLQSEVGNGTTFNIYIPALPSAAEKANTEIDPAKLQAQGETILLVDDEPAIREVFEATLTSHGYRVLTAAHGKEALDIMSGNQEQIDLAIVDMMMPIMDGPKIIQALGTSHPALLFIGITGLDQQEKFKNLGPRIFATLLKPIATETMLLTLRQALSANESLTKIAPGNAKTFNRRRC